MSRNYELKALITGVDKLSPKLKELRSKIGSFRRDMRKASDNALPVAGGFALGVGVAGKAFAEAEDAAVGLEVAMMKTGGRVAPEFKKISDLASGLGNRLPGTTAEFQDMMTMLIRQGVPVENILGGLGEATAYLAVQLKKPPAEAAEFAAKMQDATKTVSGDMMGLMDVIQRAFYLGVDDSNMLAAFSKLSPALDMIKKKGLEGAKAMAPLVVMMDQAGMSGEAGGNAIRKVLQSGFNAKRVDKANDIGGLGLDFTDGKGEFGGIEKMFAQLDKLKGLNTAKRTGVLTALFGDDAETLQVASVMIDKGLVGYRDVQQRMADQASLQLRVNKQLGTLKNLWDSATGTFTNALVGFGEAISPELKSLTEFMGDMSVKLQKFTEEHPGVVRGLVAVAGGLVAFKLAALGGAFAAKILMNALTMSPLGIFLRVLAVGAALVIANWEPIKAFFGSLWGDMRSRAGAFFDFMKGLFFNFTPLGLIIKNWEPIVAWFKGMWARIAPYLEPVIKFFGGGAKASPVPPGSGVLPQAGVGRESSPAARGSLVQQQAQVGRQQLQGELSVRFENAPAGMRVSPAKTSQPGVRMTPDVGYNPLAWLQV